MKKLVIIGAGGFAKETAWLVEDINSVNKEWQLIGFIDEDKVKHGKILNGYPVIGDFYCKEISENAELYTVCAVGNPKVKERLVQIAKLKRLKFANLIHPKVTLARHVKMGEGNIICVNSIISVNVTIGNHVSVSPSSAIGHDSIIDDYSTILWSVNLSGNCEIGIGCDIGTKSTVMQGLKVGSWSVIGAGAVVIRDIPPGCVAVGVPAHLTKIYSNFKIV